MEQQDHLLTDPAEFRRFVTTTLPDVQRLVFRLTGWHSEIEDIVQEIYLAAQQNAERYCGKGTQEAWIRGITINHCRLWARSQVRRRQRESTAASEQIDESRPIDSLLKSEDTQAVQTALGCLSHDDRELIVLRYLEDYSISRISALLQQRANTVEVRLHRARQRLKRLLCTGSSGFDRAEPGGGDSSRSDESQNS